MINFKTNEKKYIDYNYHANETYYCDTDNLTNNILSMFKIYRFDLNEDDFKNIYCHYDLDRDMFKIYITSNLDIELTIKCMLVNDKYSLRVQAVSVSTHNNIELILLEDLIKTINKTELKLVGKKITDMKKTFNNFKN